MDFLAGSSKGIKQPYYKSRQHPNILYHQTNTIGYLPVQAAQYGEIEMKEPRSALANLCCLNAHCKAHGQRALTKAEKYGDGLLAIVQQAA